MNKPTSPDRPQCGFILPGDPDAFDRSLHAAVARYTAGLSPIALSQAWWDWAAHLAASPGRRAELLASAATKIAAVMSGPAAGGSQSRQAPMCGLTTTLGHLAKLTTKNMKSRPANSRYE